MNLGASIVFAALIFSSGIPRTEAGQELREAQIQGTVTDVNDARVENAALIFQGDTQSYKTETGVDGKYSILLEPGTYTVSLSRQGFRPLRRAAFLAQKGASIRFDFQLWVSSSDSSGTYNFVELDAAPNSGLKPLVLFGESHKQDALQEFTGPVSGKRYPAVLTFNLLTISARRITYNRYRHLVVASGDVVWEDGKNVNTDPKVEVALDGLEPAVHRYLH